MSTQSRNLWILALIVLWLLYSIFIAQGCYDTLCPHCRSGEDTITAIDSTAPPVNNYPLGFLWSDQKPYTTDGFAAMQKDIIDQMTDNNILEIRGIYFDDETNPEGTENIGLARAEALQAMFVEAGVPADRIRTGARADDAPANAKFQYFEAIEFEWNTPEEQEVETVEEMADRILIRFPFNSIEKIYDPKVDDYLAKLAERVKETGESIELTGHTDNVGGDEFNNDLGMRRSMQILSILIKKGVDSKLITADTKGKTQPVRSNETEEGRYENRRVEVRLIKNENNSESN